MPTTYVAIKTVTVGAGGIGGIEFTNIPQTYTDLLVKLSLFSSAGSLDSLGLIINNVNQDRVRRNIYGSNGSATTNTSTYRDIGATGGTNFTALPSNVDVYITNYTSSSQFKTVSTDGVVENNGANNSIFMSSFYFQNTSAITNLQFDNSTSGTNYAQYSTATLYGIKNI